MGTIQINDCFYFPENKRLCLVSEINDINVRASTIVKVSIRGSGYINVGECTYFEEAFINARKQKEDIFFKITKLLELNYSVCTAILKQAKVMEASPFIGYATTFWTVLQHENTAINISTKRLFTSEISCPFNSDFIDEDTYNKINANCVKTMTLIDELWPK